MSLENRGHKGVFLDKIILTTVNRPHGITMGTDNAEALEKLRKKHKIDPKKKLADIIIPHHNRHDHLKRCLEGIDNSLFNIIIVSGGTFAENCNKGAKLAVTETLIFLNDDVETVNDNLKSLACADYDLCGISQYIGGTKFYGMGWMKTDLTPAKSFFLATTQKDFFLPSGFCFMISKKFWEKLKGFDERFRNGAEDCDLFLRAVRAKIKIGYIDKPMIHHHSQSAGRFKYTPENDELFNKLYKFKDIIKLKKCTNN